MEKQRRRNHSAGMGLLGLHRSCSFEACEPRVMMAADLRTPIAANEGYLKYQSFSISGGAALYGHERSGETKTTSPSDPAVTNSALGYDWSSVDVDFRTITVQHSGGQLGKERPGIEIDFEFANQIFAAAGVTAHHADPAGIKNYANVPNVIPDRPTARMVASHNRAAAGDEQVNVYLVGREKGTFYFVVARREGGLLF
jgi:hypothetical protein